MVQKWWHHALYVFFFVGLCASVQFYDHPHPRTKQTLKEAASFRIGAAVKTKELNGAYLSTVKEHFSQITAEYEMKMEVIWANQDDYNFVTADRLVDFALENELAVHGHALLWYLSYPAWFKDSNFDSATFEVKCKSYIETVVNRYKGRVISWDVANEIFKDDGTLRSTNCPVFKTFNDPIGFYGRCFQYARDAEPQAKLFYNDYNIVVANRKRNAIKALVDRFTSEGYPIDGIGDQFHYSVDTDTLQIKAGLSDIASTGLLVHISELDLKVNIKKSDVYLFSPAEQELQAEMYQFIVESFESLPQHQKFAITTWGISDKITWLKGWWHPIEYPLLFDAEYKMKPAYYGFLKGLRRH